MEDMVSLSAFVFTTLERLWTVIIADFWLSAIMSIWIVRKIADLFHKL